MNKKTLLGIAKEVHQLPDYLRGVCLDAIRKEWMKNNSLLQKISSGETTLEQIVLPLVEENKRVNFWGYKKGVCNSNDFNFMATSIADELQGIISFEDGFRILKEKTDPKEQVFPTLKNIWVVIILTLVAMPLLENIFLELENSIPASPIFLIATGFILSLVKIDSYRAWVESRKKKAQDLLASARFLDGIFKK